MSLDLPLYLDNALKVATLFYVVYLLLVNNSKGGFQQVVSSEVFNSNTEYKFLQTHNIVIIIVSTVIFSVYMHVLGVSFFEDKTLLVMFFDAFILLVLLLIKIVFVFLSGNLLDENNLFRALEKELITYLMIMSFVCILLSFIVINYNLDTLKWTIITLCCLEFAWYMRVSFILLQITRFNFLYFFSYICSLEIIPTLVLATYVGVI